MEYFHQSIDEVLAVRRPLFTVDGKKADLITGEEGTTVFWSRSTRRVGGIDVACDIVEQSLHEGPELGVGGRPFAARVRLEWRDRGGRPR